MLSIFFISASLGPYKSYATSKMTLSAEQVLCGSARLRMQICHCSLKSALENVTLCSFQQVCD